MSGSLLKSNMLTQRTCSTCNIIFTGYQNRKYCDKCAALATKRQYTKSNHKRQEAEYATYSKGKTKCLICGGWVVAPAMHSYQKHNVTAREYKETFNIAYQKGLIPEELKIIKRDHVFHNKTVNNLNSGAETRFTPGEDRCYDGLIKRKSLHQIKGFKKKR